MSRGVSVRNKAGGLCAPFGENFFTRTNENPASAGDVAAGLRLEQVPDRRFEAPRHEVALGRPWTALVGSGIGPVQH